MKGAFFSDRGAGDPDLNRIFSAHLKARLQSQTELLPQVVTPSNFESLVPQLRDLEVIFATWGMWRLSAAQLAALPRLKAVFYAAGSVRYFAEPLLERSVVVSSASAANAVPVAEFTLAQIILANKGYFHNVGMYREVPDHSKCFRGQGNYGATVSVLGVGQIGRKLIELLRPFHLRVLAFDPFLSHKAAEHIGIEKVGLDEAFARGNVVTNHLADVRETCGLLQGKHFRSLCRNATFINTGRGVTVNHDDLIAFLQSRPDVMALLDVTDPEPLPLSSPLRALPNVHISGHIAGSLGDEVERMGEHALREFTRWSHGEPLHYAVTLQMLETMA